MLARLQGLVQALHLDRSPQPVASAGLARVSRGVEDDQIDLGPSRALNRSFRGRLRSVPLLGRRREGRGRCVP